MIIIIIITLLCAAILWCNSIYLMVSFSCMLAKMLCNKTKHLTFTTSLALSTHHQFGPCWAPEFGRYQENISMCLVHAILNSGPQ